MPYINFKLIEEKGISYNDYLILQCCKQMKSEDLSNQLINLCGDSEEPVLRLEDAGYVTFIKGKAKDSFFQKARVTDKGSDLLSNIETVGITNNDIITWDWLAAKYIKIGKEIGNAKKGKGWLAQFRGESGIVGNDLILLCNRFSQDESRMEYSHRLDYVFFKPKDLFTTRFDLEDSKLWQYYVRNKSELDAYFEEERIKREAKIGNDE